MRRIVLWFAATAFVMVLLLGYRTSTAGPGTAPGPRGAQPPGVVAAPTAAPASTPASPAPAASGPATLVNGQVVDTRWGPVQVQVRIVGHRIADVAALVYPNGNDRDASINAYALPQLRDEVLTAQSARIDGVSGATVTSDGYRASLQSALDAAHFSG